MEAEHVLAVGNELGEGPLWIPDQQALYWVDINKRLVYYFRPSTCQYTSWQVDVAITCLGERASGGFVVATTRGFAFWHPQDYELSFVARPEADKPSIRFNDGAVDCQGRFWAGTVNAESPRCRDGSLYRLDPDRSAHRMARGFTCSNGIGWSPDNRTMYFADTHQHAILAFDYDAVSGAISNQRLFVHIPFEEGVPDGLAVDREGFVWCAHWNGWRVTRYSPAGKVQREVHLPVQKITSCAFGGSDLDELYITTACEHLSEDERKRQPLAGDLFRIKVEVPGLATPQFTG